MNTAQTAPSASRKILFLPDAETSVDLIYFEPIASAVTSLITTSSDKPVTIGVHGDWGAGKSSVLRMVEANLKSREDVLVLHFDGWRFQGFDDAKTVLLETIVSSLRDSRRIDAKVRDEVAKFLKRVRWLKLAKKMGQIGFNLWSGMLTPGQMTALAQTDDDSSATGEQQPSGNPATGPDAKPPQKNDDQILSDEASVAFTVHTFAQEFEKLLAKTKLTKLVVLIDDLDRCLPETTIETLEAIRLFLFVRKTAFVIAADEGMIEYAVRQHFPELPASTTSTSYARNYLEKLIQTPLRLPSLGVEESKIYVTLLLVQAILGEEHDGFKKLITAARDIIRQPWLSHDLSIDTVRALDTSRTQELTEAYQLALQIGRPIAEGTSGNPRQIKRFINALAVREAIAIARGLETQIRRPELAKLMLAERFRPSFYTACAASALASKGGIATEIASLEACAVSGAAPEAKSAKPDEKGAEWAGDDWIVSWLQIEPKLATTDLRPYVFIARDRRVVLGTAATSEAVALVLAAVAGGKLALAGADQAIRSLTPADAEIVYNELSNKLLEAADLKHQRDEFHGLCSVIGHHAPLRGRFLDLLSDQKPEAVGAWIVAGWRPETWETSLQARAKELIRSWSQSTNKQLKAAATPALKKLEAR